MKTIRSTRARESGSGERKRRRRSIIAFEMVRLDRTSSEPLHQGLYRQIRDELKSGSFEQSLRVRGQAVEVVSAFRRGLSPETFICSIKAATGTPMERPPRLADRLNKILDPGSERSWIAGRGDLSLLTQAGSGGNAVLYPKLAGVSRSPLRLAPARRKRGPCALVIVCYPTHRETPPRQKSA